MSSNPVLGGVYTARFPYLDSDEDKIRPVIVASKPYSQHKVIAVVPIFSRADRESVDFSLAGWQESGLLKPSTARIHRLSTLLQSDLSSRLGTLNAEDAKKLKQSLRKFLEV